MHASNPCFIPDSLFIACFWDEIASIGSIYRIWIVRACSKCAEIIRCIPMYGRAYGVYGRGGQVKAPKIRTQNEELADELFKRPKPPPPVKPVILPRENDDDESRPASSRGRSNSVSSAASSRRGRNGAASPAMFEIDSDGNENGPGETESVKSKATATSKGSKGSRAKRSPKKKNKIKISTDEDDDYDSVSQTVKKKRGKKKEPVVTDSWDAETDPKIIAFKKEIEELQQNPVLEIVDEVDYWKEVDETGRKDELSKTSAEIPADFSLGTARPKVRWSKRERNLRRELNHTVEEKLGKEKGFDRSDSSTPNKALIEDSTEWETEQGPETSTPMVLPRALRPMPEISAIKGSGFQSTLKKLLKRNATSGALTPARSARKKQRSELRRDRASPDVNFNLADTMDEPGEEGNAAETTKANTTRLSRMMARVDAGKKRMSEAARTASSSSEDGERANLPRDSGAQKGVRFSDVLEQQSPNGRPSTFGKSILRKRTISRRPTALSEGISTHSSARPSRVFPKRSTVASKTSLPPSKTSSTGARQTETAQESIDERDSDETSKSSSPVRTSSATSKRSSNAPLLVGESTRSSHLPSGAQRTLRPSKAVDSRAIESVMSDIPSEETAQVDFEVEAEAERQPSVEPSERSSIRRSTRRNSVQIEANAEEFVRPSSIRPSRRPTANVRESIPASVPESPQDATTSVATRESIPRNAKNISVFVPSTPSISKRQSSHRESIGIFSPACFAEERSILAQTFAHRRSVVINAPKAPFDLILDICNPPHIIPTDHILDRGYRDLMKVGEGSFADVYRAVKNGHVVVMKIMPVAGYYTNGEKQPTFEDILSEALVSMEVSRTLLNEKAADYYAPVFVKTYFIKVAQGYYPEEFSRRHDSFTREHEADALNQHPMAYPEDQQFVIIGLSDGGEALDSYPLVSFNQAKSIFQQVALGLAIAEKRLDFEHRDAHISNILVRKTKEKTIRFVCDGKVYLVPSCGVHVTIIDWTLSRMTKGDQIVYKDLEKDEQIFKGKGDEQFDVYRFMRTETGNKWEVYAPKTNVFWLKYLQQKLLKEKLKNAMDDPADLASKKDLQGMSRSFRYWGSAMELVEKTKWLQNCLQDDTG